jgi:hypothetical protein
MTAGYDHDPNTQAHHDFAFCELTRCSMLKTLSQEIAMLGSAETHPSEIDGPDFIGILGPRAIDTSHL